MPKSIILDPIGFTLDPTPLIAELHLREGSANVNAFLKMCEYTQHIGRPRALYQVGYIDEKGTDYVIVDGVRFTSRILRINLEPAHRVFPYIVTGGVELDAWALSFSGMLERFWADAINQHVLRLARDAFLAHLEERYRPGQLSGMHPGSLEDWPIEEQTPLFQLLGDPYAAIGVRLLETYLMSPTKTVSGIWFPSETAFESCQLCPRENCIGRKAAYDPALLEGKYSH